MGYFNYHAKGGVTVVRKRGFCYDKDKHSINSLIEKIEGKKKVLKISNEKLGALFGMTGQAFGTRLKEGKFDFLQLVKLFEFLEFSPEEVLKLMIRKE